MALSSSLLLLPLQMPEGDIALGSEIQAAAQLTLNRLAVVVYSPLFDNINAVESWTDVQKLLTTAYVEATKVAHELGRVLMAVDILLSGVKSIGQTLERVGSSFNVVFRVDGDNALTLPPSLSSLPIRKLERIQGVHVSLARTSPSSGTPSAYPVVALGGTFDHLHAGHKILLSMAAWITGKKLIVGVTDDELLVNKSNKHVLEPLPTRIAAVETFLALFKPEITCDVVSITDIYGPTAWDDNIQALVVSKETLSGASSVARLREEKHLTPLKIFVINVISSTSSSLDDRDPEALRRMKMSSTAIREWLASRDNDV